MTLYIATVRDRQTGEVMILEHEYKSKKAYKKDLWNNGYDIIRSTVYTKEEFDKILNEDGDMLEKMEIKRVKRNIRAKIRREIKK